MAMDLAHREFDLKKLDDSFDLTVDCQDLPTLPRGADAVDDDSDTSSLHASHPVWT